MAASDARIAKTIVKVASVRKGLTPQSTASQAPAWGGRSAWALRDCVVNIEPSSPRLGHRLALPILGDRQLAPGQLHIGALSIAHEREHPAPFC
jgi:hypothetical protein